MNVPGSHSHVDAKVSLRSKRERDGQKHSENALEFVVFVVA